MGLRLVGRGMEEGKGTGLGTGWMADKARSAARSSKGWRGFGAIGEKDFDSIPGSGWLMRTCMLSKRESIWSTLGVATAFLGEGIAGGRV